MDYEKTIGNYLAFKVRGPRNNAEIKVGKPEPSGCPLDGYITSRRGWVVPAAYATRTGAPTGKEMIDITIKQYYFWFLGDTIAGITPRIEQCPGAGATFGEVAAPGGEAGGLVTAALPPPSKPDAQSREGADRAEPSKGGRAQDRAKTAKDKKHPTARGAKKTGTSSGKVGSAAKKVGTVPRGVESERKKTSN